MDIEFKGGWSSPLRHWRKNLGFMTFYHYHFLHCLTDVNDEGSRPNSTELGTFSNTKEILKESTS
jgi:hypothetical protein